MVLAPAAVDSTAVAVVGTEVRTAADRAVDNTVVAVAVVGLR